MRAPGGRVQPHVYADGAYTVRIGRARPDGVTLTGLKASRDKGAAGTRTIRV
jgi:hypothetical protein